MECYNCRIILGQEKVCPNCGADLRIYRKFVGISNYLYNQALAKAKTRDLSGAIALATKLRAAGLRAQLYGEKKKFKAKMAYADKLGIPFVIFLGEDEIAQGKCSVKNMTTGEQQTVTSNEALLMLRVAIDERNAGSVIQE